MNSITNKLCKLAIFTTGAGIAYQSALLTFDFMSGFSQTLGVVGLLMELVKFFIPMLALYGFRNGFKVRALVLSLITSLLVAMSFTASFVAVNDGFEAERKESSQYVALSEQIALMRAQAIDLRKEASSYSDKYRTKRAQIKDKALSIENNITALLSERATLKTDSVADKYGKLIAVAAALIIELLTVSTTIALSFFKEEKVSDDTYKTLNPCTTTVQEDKTVLFQAKETAEDKIRAGLVNQEFDRPSVACIRKSVTGIGSNRISEILKEFGASGLLKPRDNNFGWSYA